MVSSTSRAGAAGTIPHFWWGEARKSGGGRGRRREAASGFPRAQSRLARAVFSGVRAGLGPARLAVQRRVQPARAPPRGARMVRPGQVTRLGLGAAPGEWGGGRTEPPEGRCGASRAQAGVPAGSRSAGRVLSGAPRPERRSGPEALLARGGRTESVRSQSRSGRPARAAVGTRAGGLLRGGRREPGSGGGLGEGRAAGGEDRPGTCRGRGRPGWRCGAPGAAVRSR